MFRFLYYLARLAIHSLFGPVAPSFTESDYPNLTKKKWLVTGSTGGIGLEVCKVLARQGAELWMLGRSKTKLDAAVEQVLKVAPNVVLHKVIIDFADLRTVKPGVQLIKEQTNYLDGIVHNAGVMDVPSGTRSEQDHELTIAVNNLAPQLLQDLLDPLIVNTRDARIVWLSSLALVTSPLHGFSVSTALCGCGMRSYALSKSLNYLQAVQWSRDHSDAKTIKSIAVHPGIIKTDLTRTTSAFYKFFFNLVGHKASYGALSVLFAAMSPDVKNNDFIAPPGRLGLVRPDIYEAARNEYGAAAVSWIEDKIAEFK